MLYQYKGWRLRRSGHAWNQVWQASKHGVTMNHPSKAGLMNMIRTKEVHRLSPRGQG